VSLYTWQHHLEGAGAAVQGICIAYAANQCIRLTASNKKPKESHS